MTLFRKLGAACLLGGLLLVQSALATGYTQTKYPIVLVHGIFGFNQIFGVDYFYGVPAALQKDGAKVYIVQMSALNSNEARGEQLLSQVKQILATTGAQKVNLIAHSQGSPASRYVAAVAPGLVASVSSVGGVNKGSTLADVIRGAVPAGSVTEAFAAQIANAFGSLIAIASGDPTLQQNALLALDANTTASLTAFNASYPAAVPTSACGEGAYSVNGIRYYSWSGGSPVTNLFDVSDYALGVTSLVFHGVSNDGAVSSCSSHLGHVIRDNYRMNHLDEINHLFGLVSLFETNPVTLYRQQANRLVAAGL